MLPRKDAVAAGFCARAEMQAAENELSALHRLIRALPDDASPATAVTERLILVYHSPCYQSGNYARGFDAAALRTARARSVASWWNDGGARFLGDALDNATMIRFANAIPVLLSAELLPKDDPLRAVLCPTFAVCDPIAEGAALDVARELERTSLRQSAPAGEGNEPTLQACVDAIGDHPPNERLARYADCARRLAPVSTTMPDAHYRSPKGWLVLRGRRGHYTFCDEARAYDLETGSAYVASRCSGLVLGQGGSVDQDATRAAGAVKTQVGTVSVDALRRLALLLWVKDHVTRGLRRDAEFPLPVNVPKPDPTHTFGFGSSNGGWRHSGQTHLSFGIVDAQGTLLSGHFLWPNAWEAADQAADDLVVSAEATLKEGCPTAALPRSLTPASALGGVSAIDASPDALQKTADDLGVAFAALRKTKVCKKR